jgi:hypothetical protein
MTEPGVLIATNSISEKCPKAAPTSVLPIAGNFLQTSGRMRDGITVRIYRTVISSEIKNFSRKNWQLDDINCGRGKKFTPKTDACSEKFLIAIIGIFKIKFSINFLLDSSGFILYRTNIILFILFFKLTRRAHATHPGGRIRGSLYAVSCIAGCGGCVQP